jgi:hypothetical protein
MSKRCLHAPCRRRLDAVHEGNDVVGPGVNWRVMCMRIAKASAKASMSERGRWKRDVRRLRPVLTALAMIKGMTPIQWLFTLGEGGEQNAPFPR